MISGTAPRKGWWTVREGKGRVRAGMGPGKKRALWKGVEGAEVSERHGGGWGGGGGGPGAVSQTVKTQKVKELFYPVVPEIQKSIAFWKVPRPRPFVLLVRDMYACN
jgi:hypothetical protein